MSVTSIASVIVPEVYLKYMRLRTMVKSKFFSSGIIVSEKFVTNFLSGGGKTEDLPFWKDLAGGSNIGSDDSGSESTPRGISTGKDTFIRQNRNQSWGAMDLAGVMAGDDPLAAITDFVGDFWAREFDTFLLQTIKGVFADNIANDSSDMVHSVLSASSGVVTDANRISGEAILDTFQTLGDEADLITAMSMHSVPYNRLKKLQLIDTIPDARGETTIEVYLKRRVIVTDRMWTETVDGNTAYQTVFFGTGVVVYGESDNGITPVETVRKAASGDGQGQEVHHSRRQFSLHPRGIKFTSTALAGQSPSDDEMADATNWDRVYPERKQIRLAMLRTNG